MAVKPTPNNSLYKGLVFDGVDSRDYGIYITGEAVFNSPERDVEMIEIPGRNGAYALDKGRFSNIEVSYPAGIFGDTEADFRQGISAFRNALASRKGYKRLEDDYNPDEYRMAVYKSGLEVTPTALKAGEFAITFDCKPQRFLKSGETAVTIGGDVTNPQTKSGSIVSIESDGGDKVTSLVAQITPVQAGSGDPSPTNVRPITGWTAANVNVAEKNLIDFKSLLDKWGSGYTDLGDGSYNVRTIGTGYREPFRFASKDIDVTLSGEITQLSGSAGWRLQLLNSSGEAVAALGSGSTTLSGKGCKLRLNYSTSGTGANYKNIQVELGTAATSYEPYKGTTYPVSFGSAATVYGGTLDAVSGMLTVTHKMHVFDGTETLPFYSMYNGVRFQDAEMNTTQLPIRDFIANTMKGAAARGAGGTPPCIKTYSAATGADTQFLFVCMPATDTESAAAWLQAHPTQVVYPITPKTYQLTAQQVELLTGQNHVWADTGDITITWGDDPNKLVNPTLYNAHPLLSFTASGSGTITINNDTIDVTNQPIGDIILANVTKLASGESVSWSDTGRYLTGDAIRIDSIPAITTTVILDTYSYANYTQYSGDDMDYLSTTATARGTMTQHSIPNPPQFVAGTARSVSYTGTVINKVKNKSSGTIVDCTINLTVTIAYDGAHSITATTNVTTSLGTASTTVTIDTVTVNSTKSSLTGTAYIDLDIGEAYSIDGGAVVSINDSVSLGASLPVLKPSTNTISKTGSVANLTIIPRWWEL